MAVVHKGGARVEDDGGGHDDAAGEDRVGACVAVRVVGGNLSRHILVGDGVATGGRGDGDETSGVGENDGHVQDLEVEENSGPEAAAGLPNPGALPDSNIRRLDPQTSRVTGIPLFVLYVV